MFKRGCLLVERLINPVLMKKINRVMIALSICATYACNSPNPAPVAKFSDTLQSVQAASVSDSPLQKDGYLITFSYSPETVVKVSDELEPDSLRNALIADYIYQSILAGKPTDSAAMKTLVATPAFNRALLLFFSESGLSQIYNPSSDINLVSYRCELLYHLTNNAFLHKLADTLLQLDNFEGVEALWEKADTNALPSLAGYIGKLDTTAFTRCADLAVFFHLQKDKVRSGRFLQLAAKADAGLYSELEKLLRSGKKFDHMDYAQTVYDGI